VFETFILGAEKMWSISSGWRYEDLASHYTKNKFPWVGGSIGLSRLLSVLRELWKLEYSNKTTTEVLVISMGEENLEYNISVLSFLRKNNIASELYIDANAKIQKQFKYANNKNIPYVLIAGEEEQKKWIVQLKKLSNGEQKEISLEQICDILL